ncbi:coatomer subunit alpha [Globomyces sp. JEL0801]|nr:coatomer subunit alpha [Globomyces sp. JEL0801]
MVNQVVLDPSLDDAIRIHKLKRKIDSDSKDTTRLTQRSGGDKELANCLFKSFLERTKQEKLKALELLTKEIELLTEDLTDIQNMSTAAPKNTQNISNNSNIEPQIYGAKGGEQFDRLQPHMLDLQESYFDWRLKSDLNQEQFANSLVRCTKFTQFRTLATLHYGDNYFNFASSIVSSIEFDKDDEYFATAGVTRKIKIYDYASVTDDYSDLITSNCIGNHSNSLDKQKNGVFKSATIPRFPIQEMDCQSKISCLGWNLSSKATLVSSDYEGIVTLWDTSIGIAVVKLDEHEKRAWSVDFNEINTNMFASGGDDSKVKLWSINQKSSTGTIETKANVCSVKFHPTNPNELAYGSADHHIHYHDLRNMSTPLMVFKGHQKAVSYVKFVNPKEFVTASTDCSLRLWSVDGPKMNSGETAQIGAQSIRKYTGHINEKNFVGLSINCTGEFICCGSETNQVVAYYSNLSQPVATHRFGNNIDAISGIEVKEEDPAQFVSSVCWKRKSPNILVCANSQGRVKVMEMI